MKNKRALIIAGLMLMVVGLLSAQTITLEECWEKARANYPLNDKSVELIEASTRQQLANIRTAWLPQFEVGAQATWQNDVPHISGMPLMQNIPMAPKDQYKFGVEVNQTLYDGNIGKARSRIERASGNIEKQNIEVQLRDVSYLVSEVYFTLLLITEQKKQFESLIEDLNNRLKEISSAVEAGVVLRTEYQIIEVERLKIEKLLIGIEEHRKALIGTLSLFTGSDFDDGLNLEVPNAETLQQPVLRPEFDLFRYQKERIEADRSLNKVTRFPVVAAFGQLGYGNPGFNMLKDEFDTYYMIGIRLKWRPWDWNTAQRNNLSLDNRAAIVQMQQQAFEREQSRATLQIDSEIIQYQQKVEKDNQIAELQSSIVQTYRVRLKSGTITAAEYITAANNESRAQLDVQITKIGHLQSLARKYLTSGRY